MVFIRFQPFRFDARLTFRTFFPSVTWSFIATDMYILWWEYFDDFTHYIFQELHGFIITDAEYVFKYAPTRTHFIWTTRTSHFWISGQCSKHVSRQVYFRNYCDVAFLCIFHDFFSLFLCIEAAIRCIVILLCVFSNYRATALRTYFRKFRIFFNLNTPALVFRQVPVESIHIVQCQQVYIFLYKLFWEEVTPYVEVHTAVTETRFVLNFTCRYQDGCSFGFGGNGFA